MARIKPRGERGEKSLLHLNSFYRWILRTAMKYHGGKNKIWREFTPSMNGIQLRVVFCLKYSWKIWSIAEKFEIPQKNVEKRQEGFYKHRIYIFFKLRWKWHDAAENVTVCRKYWRELWIASNMMKHSRKNDEKYQRMVMEYRWKVSKCFTEHFTLMRYRKISWNTNKKYVTYCRKPWSTAEK